MRHEKEQREERSKKSRKLDLDRKVKRYTVERQRLVRTKVNARYYLLMV